MLKLICMVALICPCLIFSPAQSCAWWGQNTQAEKTTAVSQTAEEINQAIKKQLEEQVKNLSVENQTLKEKNVALETERVQVSADKENLLGKLKDYTFQRENLDARIKTIELGIINLNEIKKTLETENKNLTEQIIVLQKELEPARKVRRNFKDKMAKFEKRHKSQMTEEVERQREKYEKQIKELNDKSEKLKEEKEACLEENILSQRELKKAMEELIDTKAYLEGLKKDVATMHYNLAVIFDEDGRYDRALGEYKEVLKVKPNDAETHYNMAVIYDAHKKDRQKAIYHYRMYLRIRPDAEDADRVKEWITEGELEEKVWHGK